ncbi:MAG: YihY/virulence factor BrkB family protein [Planctomycetota bacterium]|nr:YihY/virulence factor BrkB family protein [Planctomycetota bacterium]
MSDAPPEAPPLWRLVWEKVRADNIPLRAGALSFTTLASLLPLTAIVLAVLSGPAFEEQRERALDRVAGALVPAPLGNEYEYPIDGAEFEDARLQTIAKLKGDIQAVIAQLSGNLGKIGIFSFLVLLYIALQLCGTVEGAFNAIWHVPVGRSVFMKLAVTTALLFWGPTVVIFAFALTAKLPDLALFRYLLPLLLTGFAFTALYMIMPNARVRTGWALAGGMAAAVAWELCKIGFLVYIGYAVGASKLYGSLGLVPVVFAWVFLSWMVVLGGGELAYALQNREALRERGLEKLRALGRTGDAAALEAARAPALALAGTLEIARRYREGLAPGGSRRSELAKELRVEPGELARALERMLAAGLLARVAEPPAGADDPRYLPAIDPARCALREALRAARGPEPGLPAHERFHEAAELLLRANERGEADLAGKTLADLLPVPPPKPGESAAPLGAVAPKPAP